MPNSRAHIVTGTAITISAFLIIKNYKNFDLYDLTYILYLPVIFYYSLLPDIDLPNSKVRKFTVIFGLFLSLVFSVLAIILDYKMLFIVPVTILFGLIIIQFFTHRNKGKTHTIRFALLVSLPLLLISWLLALLAFISFISHLFIDDSMKF